MNEIKLKEIAGKTLCSNTFTEEFEDMDKEDKDLYLFLRGGLTAK